MFRSADDLSEAGIDLLAAARGQKFSTILADPPWQFQNRHRQGRARTQKTLTLRDDGPLTRFAICRWREIAADRSHLYLWVPNALLPEGLRVMEAWGYRYVSNLVWHKVRKDGGSDGRGVGFYFRNVTELLLFGTRGKHARTLDPGRSQVNMMQTRKREHSRKPDEQYKIIEDCSWGPRLEMFSRGKRRDWTVLGQPGG